MIVLRLSKGGLLLSIIQIMPLTRLPMIKIIMPLKALVLARSQNPVSLNSK